MKSIYLFLILFCGAITFSCAQTDKKSDTSEKTAITSAINSEAFPTKVITISKSAEEWKSLLSSLQFNVLREQGTERAFTGEYWANKNTGTYFCSGCGLALFASDTKFKSGTGWPSFWEPINKSYVGEHVDESYGMTRTEVHCARCNGHLGHIFPDGPKPTGLRYCINSVSLTFKAKEE